MGIIAALMREWKLTLLATVTALFLVQSMHLKAVTAQRDLAVSELANYKRLAEVAATTAKSLSEKALKETRDAIPELVEQAKNNAWANYKAKFGLGNAACGIRAVSVLHAGREVRDGEAGIPGRGDELHQSEPVATEESTIATCGFDAGLIESVKRWAVTNELKISKE